jgi:ankyrin repeat protein
VDVNQKRRTDGVDVNKATTDDGVTPLYMACLGGHIEVVGMLLTCDGIDVNKAKTDIGATPLFMACQNGRTEVVQMLLSCSGVDAINQAKTTDGSTPLHTAARNDQRAVAQLLVAYGADMTATTLNGSSAKSECSQEGARRIGCMVWCGGRVVATPRGCWVSTPQCCC